MEEDKVVPKIETCASSSGVRQRFVAFLGLELDQTHEKNAHCDEHASRPVTRSSRMRLVGRERYMGLWYPWDEIKNVFLRFIIT